ncbi:hypothetical protein [Streptomyces sp. NPDC001933]|uniref:hypothetical protein n=1 Tax=Streptomyces sp. NPDC001933 TaxID=3364626 RepID=UPI0036B4A6CE
MEAWKRIRTDHGSTAHSPVPVAGGEQAGELGNDIRGRFEVAADILRLLGIARTVATYVLEALSGEPGDLGGRLQAFRAAWSTNAD